MQMFTACIFVLINLQSTGTAVDCPTACSKCRENREYFALLDVYCAMCKECRERRQEWINRVPSGRRFDSEENRAEDYQEDCPMPPPCEPEDESPPITLRSSVPTTTTTISTTTPSTTTKRPCPPVPNCKKVRQKKPRQSCCIPICPYLSNCPSGVGMQQLTQSNTVSFTSRTTNTGDFFYVHVGVPQDLLNNL